MVCDLFVFLNIKNNPKVNCLFHTARPSAGFTLGFGGWGLLWGLRRRDPVINDGMGKVYGWDTYAESAAFSTCLFHCLTKHDDKYVMLVFVLVVCWVFWFVFFFLFVSLLPFAPIPLAHPGLCSSLQSCYSIHAVSLCWDAFWAKALHNLEIQWTVS